MKKHFLLGYRNKEIGLIKYKKGVKKTLLGLGLISMSFIIPDLGIGMLLGVMVLSPLDVKKQFRNLKEDIKLFKEKKLIQWGLK